VFGLVDPQPDSDGEQVPVRDHVLAGVLQRADDHDADRPALREPSARGMAPNPQGRNTRPGA
jgi:hypothetical protein